MGAGEEGGLVEGAISVALVGVVGGGRSRKVVERLKSVGAVGTDMCVQRDIAEEISIWSMSTRLSHGGTWAIRASTKNTEEAYRSRLDRRHRLRMGVPWLETLGK